MRPYYKDASVTLYHGDLRECDDWLRADVLVTDPPYGMAYKSGRTKMRMIAGDSDVKIRDEALALWGKEKPFVVFGTWRIPKPENLKAMLIWDKMSGPGMGDLAFPWGTSTEEIYIRGTGFHRLRKREGQIVRIPRQPFSRRCHDTEKPIALLSYLIDRCPPGIVADPFAGSGSTLVAAKLAGRRAIGVELEERHCESIANRLVSTLCFLTE